MLSYLSLTCDHLIKLIIVLDFWGNNDFVEWVECYSGAYQCFSLFFYVINDSMEWWVIVCLLVLVSWASGALDPGNSLVRMVICVLCEKVCISECDFFDFEFCDWYFFQSNYFSTYVLYCFWLGIWVTIAVFLAYTWNTYNIS